MSSTSGRSKAAPKKQTIKVISRGLPVRHEPTRNGQMLCTLHAGYILQYTEEVITEDIVWIRVSSGWICSRDTNGFASFETVSENEGHKFWALEYDRRKRISAAIGAMLTKSLSLPEARRFAQGLVTLATNFIKGGKSLIGLPDVSLDDILVGINGAVGLRQREVFEFIKITASQQSSPMKCVVDMCKEIESMLSLRPTLWVKNKLGILTTSDLSVHNNNFIMAAAKGDIATLSKCLDMGQELSVLHTELQYTALHSAADFGSIEAVEMLLKTGLSPNIKDAKYGATALHFAAASGRSEIATLLINYQADRTIPNHRGVLPFEIAKEQGYQECCALLKYPPPEIQHASIVDCTHTSITVEWTPPILKERLHSKILNYIVEWVPLDQAKYGHGQQFETTETTFTVNNLHPASGHSFVFYSRSISGVSKLSTCMTIHFTLCTVPDQPPPVELLKVTKNGMLLNWHDPESDNGANLLLWELEVVDYDSLCNLGLCKPVAREEVDISVSALHESSDTAPASKQGSPRAGSKLTSAAASAKTSPRSRIAEAQGFSEENEANSIDVSDFDDNGSEMDIMDPLEDVERPATSKMHDNTAFTDMYEHRVRQQKLDKHKLVYHKVIPHRNLSNTRKFLMGLAVQKQYGCRVRAKNDFGWSLWSEWAGPYSPRPGVACIEFSAEAAGNEWMKIGWLAPVLSNGRKVTAYELQMSQPVGALCRQYKIYRSANDETDEPVGIESTTFDFKTITDCHQVNHYIMTDLKPGSRYQYRVRAKIDDDWLDWEHGMLSQVIVVPPCAPDCPTDVRLWAGSFSKKKKSSSPDAKSKEEPSSQVDADGDAEEVLACVRSSQAVSTISFENDGVSHDFIVIQFTPGNSGGAPVIGYRIDCAKVKEYDYRDIVNARKAAAGISTEPDPDINDDKFADVAALKEKLNKGVGEGDGVDQLEWVDVTENSVMMGPSAFKVNGLQVGTHYVFRMQQKNEVAWSKVSLGSAILSTCHTPPPSTPIVCEIGTSFSVIQWTIIQPKVSEGVEAAVQTQIDKAINSFTVLDYQVALGHIPSEDMSGVTTSNFNTVLAVSDDDKLDLSQVNAESLSQNIVWVIGKTRQYEGSLSSGVKPGMNADGDIVSMVLVDDLVAASFYCLRVKVLTVAGWSPWSPVCDIFRTLSVQ